MKIYLLFLVLYLSGTHGVERGDLEQYGLFQLFLNIAYYKCDKDKALNPGVSDVTIHFYDFSKNSSSAFPIHKAAKGILTIPNLDIKRKFIVYVAGCTSTMTTYSMGVVRDAFRNLPNSYFIAVDYSPYTTDSKKQLDYNKSVMYSYYVGKATAKMLADIKRGGIPTKNMHCIGYSLGGQIVGYAGQAFFENTGEKLSRVTALDPAGPCYSNGPITDQVRAGVADYVEVYHCNVHGFGSDSVLADVDFYLNHKGEAQPKCDTPYIPKLTESASAAICNHVKCIEVWATTIKHPDKFIAYKCESYQMFKKGRCSEKNTTRPGFWNPGTAKGTYYFYTDGYESDSRDFRSVLSKEVAKFTENISLLKYKNDTSQNLTFLQESSKKRVQKFKNSF